jgi:HKD family nuclease
VKPIIGPFAKLRLGDFLRRGLNSKAEKFDGAAAFARSSGVRHLVPLISKFSASRPLRLIIGVDLYGTSVEALELILGAAGQHAAPRVFHNPAATFHPKIYKFQYRDRWEVYCGSGNLTNGGLFENYEAGVAFTLSRSDPTEIAIADELEVEFERWSDGASGASKALTTSLIMDLRNEGLVLRESALKRVTSAARRAAGAPKKRTRSIFSSIPIPPSPNLPVSVPSAQTKVTAFVMTIEPSDAAPTKNRSPEFFIPKLARDLRPNFWGWPQLYVQNGNAMNRYNTPLRFRGQNEPSTLFGYANRSEFRLRNSRIKAAAAVGDILRIRHDESNPGLPYEVDVIAQGTQQHARELRRCVHRATASTRLYGYY